MFTALARSVTLRNASVVRQLSTRALLTKSWQCSSIQQECVIPKVTSKFEVKKRFTDLCVETSSDVILYVYSDVYLISFF